MSLSVSDSGTPPRFRAIGPQHIDDVAARYGIPEDALASVRAVSQVLPFRVNEYVLSELVDWHRIPDDPVYQLVFPQRGMLAAKDESLLVDMLRRGVPRRELAAEVARIRAGLNPHPSGQKELNVPRLAGEELAGVQHKYRETVLYFPQQGQTCHSYCTYCFRWAQFIGDADLRFAAPGPAGLVEYLKLHPAVSDVLVTGGDPMVMTTERLRGHLEPVLSVDTVRTVRIGTKSVAYWPQRFVTDPDADDVLRLFEDVVASGRNLAVMAHFSHPRELETALARRALARIRATGALVYCQAPLIAHVNDDARTWAELWRGELSAGAVPYYMFVERDTGPRQYFEVPLVRAYDIFRAAYQKLPGLARTVRGPVMSATPGKVAVDGVEETPRGRFLRLRMLQARRPELVGRPFLARWSATAAWMDQLELDSSVPADIAAAFGGPAGDGVSGERAGAGRV
ncbi:KamA family radical SAM protein [Streptomyces sp. NPDC093094]|uniref:KamA family radical SAM protein n=1 Tax=Streptomyces sp. NPDC093094 TaxID=3366026 RepID=UPI0037FE3342